MAFGPKHYICAILCLSLCISCHEEKEEPLPPVKTTSLGSEDLLYIDQLFPELKSSPSILYDEVMGYYIPFGEKEWSRSWSVGPAYIPAQSSSFPVTASWISDEGFTGWIADDTRYVVLEDVRLPETASNLVWGNCRSVFKMTISLGDGVPYRKVTLSDLAIRFPDSFRAQAEGELYGSIPELEVTAEGAVVTFDLNSVFQPDQFVDAKGRLCYSLKTTVSALVTALPEDAVGSGTPAEISFQCSLEFDRIDFTECSLDFHDLSFPVDKIEWDAVPPPSFLCGEGTDITFTQPYILFAYRNDFPLNLSHVEAVACSGDGKAAFSAEGENLRYMFMGTWDAVYRDDIVNKDVPALGNLFKSPFPGGMLQPSLLLQPVADPSGVVVPGQEYRMSVKADLKLPLIVDGDIHVDGCPTPPVKMEGASLGAVAGYPQKFEQLLGSSLPFDCRITPVFTMDGEEPVFLDDFVLDKNNRLVEISFRFTPAKDDWTATIHYIVTPVRGWNERLDKYARLSTDKTYFTANLRETR